MGASRREPCRERVEGYALLVSGVELAHSNLPGGTFIRTHHDRKARCARRRGFQLLGDRLLLERELGAHPLVT